MEIISPIGLAAAVGGALMLGGALITRRHRHPSDGYGSSHFSTPQEISRAKLLKPHGVILGYTRGRPLYAGSNRHVLMVGPSGSGKTELLLKTLQRTRQSVIALDLKGSLRARSQRRRQALGGPIYTFDPVYGGDHLNPWDLIPWGTGKEVAGIQRLVSHLTYVDADTKTDAGIYYRDVAQPALWAMIAYLHYSQVAEASFGGLYDFLHASDAEMLSRVKDMRAFGHPLAQKWGQSMADKTKTQLQAIWSAAQRWLYPWADPVHVPRGSVVPLARTLKCLNPASP